MKVITEAVLREQFKGSAPDVYYLPEGTLLSPAAKEYLQHKRVKLERGSPPGGGTEVQSGSKRRYTDYVTGKVYEAKPEYMTQLKGNVLVMKNHPRIVLRGKLDSLQAEVVRTQTELAAMGESGLIIEELADILAAMREMMRCEVMEEPFYKETIIGLTMPQLRERSHYPMKFYSVKQMLLPHYSMGKTYAMLNELRTAIRECELAAVNAFCEGSAVQRDDILQTFNRLSGALHIMMCRYLAGEYGERTVTNG